MGVLPRGWLLPLLLLTGSAQAQAQPKVWAIVVGIDEYVRPSVPKLRYAVADAKLFSQALQETLGVPKEQIFLMTSDAVDENSQPRLVNVAYRLSTLKGKIKKDDTFIFYFAGHGVTLEGEPFLLTEEADNRSALTLKATSLHAGDLMSTLQKNESGNVWVTLDACRNNPEEKGEAKLDPTVSDSLSKGNVGLLHTATMFSCDVGERAWEWEEKKHGYYSYFLVEGLRREAADSSGRITLPGLDQYLREQVPVVTRRLASPQNPKIFYGGSTSAQWVLTTLPVAQAPPDGKKEDQSARYVARLEALQARLDSETALRVQAEQRAKLADSQRQQLEQQLAIMEKQVGAKAAPVSATAVNMVAYQQGASSRELQSEINRLREENEMLKRRLTNLETDATKVGLAPRSVMLESQPLLQKAWEGADQAQRGPQSSLDECLAVRQALTQKVSVFQAAYANALAARDLKPAVKQQVAAMNERLEIRQLLSQVYQARQEAAASALLEAQQRLDEALAREEKYKLVIAGLQKDLAEVEVKLSRCQAELVQTQTELSSSLLKLKKLQQRFDKQFEGAWKRGTHTRIEPQIVEDKRDFAPYEAKEFPPRR